MPKLSFDEALQKIADQRCVGYEEVKADALKRKVWLASSSFPGCMPETWNLCLTKQDAINELCFLADHPKGMKTALNNNHLFRHDSINYAIEAGVLADFRL